MATGNRIKSVTSRRLASVELCLFILRIRGMTETAAVHKQSQNFWLSLIAITIAFAFVKLTLQLLPKGFSKKLNQKLPKSQPALRKSFYANRFGKIYGLIFHHKSIFFL